MKSTSSQWRVLGEPASEDERQALEAIRALLPDDAVTHAWANVSFVDLEGRTAECDLLLLSRVGFFVVELKGWHGTIAGDQQTWRHTKPNGQVRNERNPLFATDLKAKRLRSLLERTAPNPQARRQVPFVDALVVLHGKDSVVTLPDIARPHVVALDGYNVKGLDETLAGLLATPPSHGPAIDGPRATQIRQAVEHAGIKPTPKNRFVGQYSLEKADPLGEGPGWQDLLAAHPSASEVRRRVRVFDIPRGASQQAREEIARTARREFVFTQGVAHAGIAAPLELVDSDLGPALIFDYDEGEVPLDEYLREHGAQLGLDARIALIRQLADTLRYAHARRLVHRALSPRRVFVRTGPRLVVRDWQTGRRSGGTTTSRAPSATSFGVADVRGLVEQGDWVYLAPEAHSGAGEAPPIPLDVYGLGALAYLILTDHAPAASLAELEERLTAHGALDPRVAQPDVPEVLAELVRAATRRVETERLGSVTEFLARLEDAEDALTAPSTDDEDRPKAADPLTATRGEVIADRFEVHALRGTGSTGTALLVDDYQTGREGVVLKIARDDAAAGRLADEAAVLRRIGEHRRIVHLLDGPLTADGRAALLLTDAGPATLAAWLESQGRATLTELERFGGHLLEAVAHLDSLGLFHRDIKPANLGVRPDPGTKVPSLVLFDLSLAREPIENTGSGTRGYLDPYLALARTATGARARRRYDRAAELYAAAVTLFEMATAQLPWWAEGDLGPATATDRAVVTKDMFEAPVARPLTEFFRRALAPDVAERFGDVATMAAAWQAAFAGVREEQGEHDEAARDEAAAAATLDTPLAEAGLTARALSALARIDATTVGQLLRTSPLRINSIPGLGEQYRKEVQRRVRQWRARLLAGTTTEQPGPLSQDRSVEAYLTSLLPKPADGNGKDIAALRVLLGLDGDLTWPTVTEAAEAVGTSRAAVAQALDAASATWRTRAAVVDARGEVIQVLGAQEDVAALGELAGALLLRHGSVAEGPERGRRAAGLVRAVVEADQRSDEPALAIRRHGPQVLVATTKARALLDEAAKLGDAARALVPHGVVPAPVAREALRSVARSRLSDDRLLRLAAAAGGVQMSSMDELYPTDLDPERAAEVALRGVTVAALTEAGVRRRVATRFPALPPLPPRPALDRLVEQAVPGLRWDGEAYAHPTHRSSVASMTTATRGAAEPPNVVDGYLRASLRSSSALTLCIHPRDHQRAIDVLTSTYGVTEIDVAARLLTAVRDLAVRDNVDWGLVESSDARPSGGDWDALRGLVADALRDPWAAILQDERPLLLVNAAPLARYGLTGMLSNLLDQATHRPAARWLLVPKRGSQAVPTLDGRPVPMGADHWIDLPHDLSLLRPGVPA